MTMLTSTESHLDHKVNKWVKKKKNAREDGVISHHILCLIMYIMLTLIKKDLIITDYCLSVDNCETIDKCLFIVCAECPF